MVVYVDGMLAWCIKWLRFAGVDTRLYSKYSAESDGHDALFLTSGIAKYLSAPFEKKFLLKNNVELKDIFIILTKNKWNYDKKQTMTRCCVCNQPLMVVEKKIVEQRLPERVRVSQKHFKLCSECGNIYWEGSHYERIVRVLEKANSP